MALKVIKQRATGNLFADSYRVVRNGNGLGREYCIKGLHTFLKSENCSRGVEVTDEVGKDLREYENYREKKKRQFSGKKNSRLEREASIKKEL